MVERNSNFEMSARKIFTVKDYKKMIDAGVFVKNSYYELLEGDIVAKFPRSIRHESCRMRAATFLTQILYEVAVVSQICPIILDDVSEPEADIEILQFRPDYYASKPHPKDVLWLIEIADETLKYDRTITLPLYAKSEVPEVWLINLPRKIVEIHTEPRDGKYKSIRKAGKSEILTPPLLPELYLKVAEIIGWYLLRQTPIPAL